MTNDVIVHIDTAFGYIQVIAITIALAFTIALIMYFKPLTPEEGEV